MIAFVLAITIGFAFILSGFPVVLDVARAVLPLEVVDAIRQMSFLTHFNGIIRGVIDARDLVFFGSLMAIFLYMNTAIVELKKAD